MTPAARVAAAIACLDAVLEGASAERTLTNWARANRYAGSGDRAAVRDHAFDALRRLGAATAAGGARTGRAVMLGLMRLDGVDPGTVFDGSRYGPSEIGPDDPEPREATRAEALNVQDWCLPLFEAAYSEAEAILGALSERAPVFVRVNTSKTSAETLVARLAEEGVTVAPHPLAETALQVTSGARGLVRTLAFAEGLFELQDAASQAAVQAVAGLVPGARVLDYCAGGGGKTLALAALGPARIVAHDIDVGRMSDLPTRAARAGAEVTVAPSVSPDERFDLVFVDAPCSGSGAWRRQAEAKWRLTPERLTELTKMQRDVLEAAARFVDQGGTLAYATCSLLPNENRDVVRWFTSENPDWTLQGDRQFTPLDGGDGFYVARLTRQTARSV